MEDTGIELATSAMLSKHS